MKNEIQGLSLPPLGEDSQDERIVLDRSADRISPQVVFCPYI